jgi:hypothetical protein
MPQFETRPVPNRISEGWPTYFNLLAKSTDLSYPIPYDQRNASLNADVKRGNGLTPIDEQAYAEEIGPEAKFTILILLRSASCSSLLLFLCLV